MALPEILFNSTGSDTAASGAGPSTALFGTAAATAANTTVTLSVDAPNLSGVATDGSAAIWVGSSSGRQWSKITAVDNGAKTVTVQTAFANTESGKNWGIGGKRATLASSTRLGLDWLAGWKIDVQTDQTLTAAYALVVPTGTETVQTANVFYCSQTTRAVITTSTNSINLFTLNNSDCVLFKHLKFTNTAGTKGSYAASTGFAFTNPAGACNGMQFADCIFDGFVCAICSDNVNVFGCNNFSMYGCEIKNCTDSAIRMQTNAAGTAFTTVDHCYIHDNTGDGLTCQNGACSVDVSWSIFANNAKGINQIQTGAINQFSLFVDHCDFKNNTGAGINLPCTGEAFTCHDCILVGNGDSGIKFAAGEATYNSQRNPPLIYNNAWYNNTTSTVANGPTTFDDITLSGDPFVSSSDYALNNTTGAGALCRGVAVSAPNATANAPGDVGAIPSGGGGTTTTNTIVVNNIFRFGAGQRGAITGFSDIRTRFVPIGSHVAPVVLTKFIPLPYRRMVRSSTRAAGSDRSIPGKNTTTTTILTSFIPLPYRRNLYSGLTRAGSFRTLSSQVSVPPAPSGGSQIFKTVIAIR